MLHLQDLGLRDMPLLPNELIHDLNESIGPEEAFTSEEMGDGPFYDGRRHLWLYKTPEASERNQDIANDPNYYDKIPQEWIDKWANREITKDDWSPGAPEDLPKSFYRFIMSSWDRFDKIEAYEPFYVYCEYARRLNAEGVSAESFTRYSQEWLDYCVNEYVRSHDNHLYALDRYVSIKDDSQPGGRRKYKASAPQALLCYLKNLSLSYVLMKGRQAAITSTEMALANLRSRVIKSYSGIVVSGDLDGSGKKIFEDKFKSTGKHLPDWFQPKKMPHNSTLRVMYEFDGGDTKADAKMVTSEFSMFSSKDSQKVNGMTPTDFYCDEAQNVVSLEELVEERMPTQLAEVNGVLTIVRQSYIWGTGNINDRGKGALERLYKSVKKQMVNGDNTQGWVALFFDGFCRPYMNKQTYFNQWTRVMRGETDEVKGRSTDDKKAMFASHYPMRDDDCFMRVENTVVPYIWIRKNLDRIDTHYAVGPKRGRFAFSLDSKRPMPKGMHVSHYIDRLSIRFEEADPSDITAPISMYMDRVERMKDQYIQGTDPIQSETGQSLMASVIMASAAHTVVKDDRTYRYPGPVCILNGRTQNPKDIFLQTKLMGMYYANHHERSCPELVEYNQGHNYLEYVESPFIDCESSLMIQPELGPAFASTRPNGRVPYGLIMSDDTKTVMHMQMNEFHSALARNVWYREYFMQVKNLQQEERRDGKIIKWGTSDSRKYNDDLVMAMLLSYVAMKAKYAGRVPKKLGEEDEDLVIARSGQYIMQADGTKVWMNVPVYAQFAA